MLETPATPRMSLSDAMSALQLQGWVALDRESRELPTLALARAVGQPISGNTGNLIKKLVPKDSLDAIPGTLSHVYGRADFPLHTDTAFWPVPARYLVMRVTGDTRRATIVAPFPECLDSTIASEVASSVWVAKGVRPFYCSMQFRVSGEVGLRYDPLTMVPANTAAVRVQSGLPAVLARLSAFSVDWETVGTVIIDNWRALHGRGSEPTGEGQRVLERIYVR